MNNLILRYGKSLIAVIKQYRWRGVVSALTAQAEFSQLIRPLGARPLIFSAHPGDEVLALAGTLATYSKLGIPMVVVTVTSGCHGTNTGKRDPKLKNKREKELLASYKVLGDIKPIQWHLEERFVVDDQFLLHLTDNIDEINPDIIYVPSLLDDHPDNRALSRALAEVLEHLPSARLKKMVIAQYELWTPITPNKILSISGFESEKRKAIECHESQLLCRNYLDAMLGLNRYRAAMLGAGVSAEAFFICSADQYRSFALDALGQTPVAAMLG